MAPPTVGVPRRRDLPAASSTAAMKRLAVAAGTIAILLGMLTFASSNPRPLAATAVRGPRSSLGRTLGGLRQLKQRPASVRAQTEYEMDSESDLKSQVVMMRNRFEGTHSEIHFNDEEDYYPIKKMQVGVRKLAAVVGCTLGPRGRNVVVQRKVGTRPRIINDGVSIAKEVHLEDDLEEIGCVLVREASERTNEDAGDGTTSAIILSDAIITEGIKRVVSGVAAMPLYRGLEKTTQHLMKFLEEEVAIMVEDDQLEDVATISASGMRDVGRMIATAMRKVGRLGLLTLEEGKGVEDVLETQEGMFVDECGYISPKLINIPEEGVAAYTDAKVLVIDGEVNQLEEIIPMMELAFEEDNPVLIIAHAFSQEVQNFLVLNHQRAGLKVAAVTAPSFGQLRSQILEDISILTGATVLGDDSEQGIDIKKATAGMLGDAPMFECGREGTLIVGPNNTAEAVDARVAQLEIAKERLDDEQMPKFEKDKINRRIAKLKGGVGVIFVGAMTELELRDRRLRYDDALCAIRSALDEGIVPGGATTYLRLSAEIDNVLPTLNDEERQGALILQKALQYPLSMVARNAGFSHQLVVGDVMKGQKEDPLYGWNAETAEYGNMLDFGVIEPAKVIRCAVENAVSVSKTFLTAEAVVIEHAINKRKQQEAEMGELQV